MVDAVRLEANTRGDQGDVMVVDRKVSVTSDSWQPDFIGKHAPDLSSYLEQVSRTMQGVADRAMELLSPLTGRKVLEVGCGNGVFLPRLAEAVGPDGSVVGIDHSEAFVAEAIARVAAAGFTSTVEVQRADAYALPFAPAAFDAAHCERLLMHLEHPTSALSEMKRVVRPGGWIVAAEPDWAGMRIDHPDRAGMDLLYARAMRSRQPDMGLTLYRRMGEIGLTERRGVPLVGPHTDLQVLKGYGLTLPPAADALVAEGLLTREHVDALLSGLEEANASGLFYGVAIMHVVAGRVPG
jgi:SAM-dependent methyltransferase